MVELGESDYQQVLGILNIIQLNETEEASIGTLIIGASYEVSIKNKIQNLCHIQKLNINLNQRD